MFEWSQWGRFLSDVWGHLLGCAAKYTISKLINKTLSSPSGWPVVKRHRNSFWGACPEPQVFCNTMKTDKKTLLCPLNETFVYKKKKNTDGNLCMCLIKLDELLTEHVIK